MEENNSFVASEPTPAYGTNSYADVMGYLHSIRITPQVKESVGRRLLVEVTEPYLAKTFARLDELSQLREDWDGEGALPISPRVIRNMKDVLLISDNEDWENWMIGPDSNACIGLQSKRSRACVSLGAKEYSYYWETDKGEEGKSHVEFSPEKLLELMRRIV